MNLNALDMNQRIHFFVFVDHSFEMLITIKMNFNTTNLVKYDSYDT